MRLRKTCTIGCLLAWAALAQTDGGLRAKVAAVHYPPLAEAARVQGDVPLEVNSGVVTLVSGHPLLAEVAIENAKTLGSIEGQTKFDITYHLVIVDTNAYKVPTVTTVKRGNALERAISRVLELKTEKVVHDIRCVENPAPASDVKTDGGALEIWVYGRDICLQTQTATLSASR